jgi:hypothetical protein
MLESIKFSFSLGRKMGLIKVNFKNINFCGICYVFPEFTPRPPFLDALSRAFRTVNREVTDLEVLARSHLRF